MKTLPTLLAATLALLSSCTRNAGPDKPADVDYYTCAMHPSVRSLKPDDKCPICSMELVPVMKDGAKGGGAHDHALDHSTTRMFTVPVARQQQIGVTYATAERRPLRFAVRSVGLIQPDAGRMYEYVSRVEGYVQDLNVTSAGERVERGQALMSIYSPDLLTTGQEFVDLLRARDSATGAMRGSTGRLVESAKRRLRLWNISDEEIAELEKTRKPSEFLVLRSPFDGIVQDIAAMQGMSVKVGDRLASIVDLSRVWLWAEFYENELPLLKLGQKLEVIVPAFPDQSFAGEIAAIDPFISSMKRTARVRIDVPNPDWKLRPGMYADVHLQVEAGEGLTIPVSAVLPTGTRMLTFLDKGEGRLEPRHIKTGRKFKDDGNDWYEVTDGLIEGDRVVASANFLIDAEAKIQGAVKSFEAEPMGEPPVPETKL